MSITNIKKNKKSKSVFFCTRKKTVVNILTASVKNNTNKIIHKKRSHMTRRWFCKMIHNGSNLLGRKGSPKNWLGQRLNSIHKLADA